MMYLKWFVFAWLALAMNILAILLSPLLSAISVIAGVNVLPGPLAWFHTHDATLDGGQTQQKALYPSGVKGWELFKQRTRWICRNPGYGFAANVVGIPMSDVVETGTLKTGLKHTFYKDGKKIGWGWRRDWYYTDKKFAKIWFGWRHPSNDGKTRMIKVMFNPFRTAE